MHNAPSRLDSLRRAAPLIITPLLFAFGFVVIWGVLVAILDTPGYLVPAPWDLPAAIPVGFANHIWVTAQEVVLGFLVANVLAFVIAVLFVQNRLIERGMYPLAIALKTTPIVAIAPLLVLWFGTGLLSKVIAAGLISFFPMLVNTIRGLRAAEPEAHELFTALRASRRQTFLRLQMPTSLPFVFAALKISASLAVVGAIVGEFVGAKAGLGFVILQSSYNFQTAQLFVAIIAAAVLGIALFGIVALAERAVCRWERVAV
ncbi:MAG: ABC transporter permease [Solirubrobacteraceae bacterium]